MIVRSRHERRLPHVTHEQCVPPRIAPRDGSAPRPLLSVMIPTYNCAGFLRDTLTSVLAQDAGPDIMHIEVVDDCSSDDPERVVREHGAGRVEFFRQPVNQGAVGNFNTCVTRSRGELVHILHGDDWVLPGFYDEILRLVRERPEAGLYATRVAIIDTHGARVGTSSRIADAEHAVLTSPRFQSAGNAIQFAGCVVRRAAYEASGGFLPLLVHTADWEMWTRITAAHGASTSPDALAAYRQSPGNDTSTLTRTAGNVIDIDRSVRVAQLLGYDIDTALLMRRARSTALRQYFRFDTAGDERGAGANHRYWRERASIRELVRRRSAVIGSRLLAVPGRRST